MCGICGFTGTTETDSRTLKAMCDVMAHRGPDGEGQYFDQGIALGHRRLSLIDLEGGNQPMIRASKDFSSRISSPAQGILDTGDYAIVFNGEIYNYQDLTQELEALGYSFETSSDTEVLLVSYIAWGKELLNKVRGMFAFAIWDRAVQELFCARDFFGIKPFYYTTTESGEFVFASEIKCILEYPGIAREVNTEALEQYLSFQYSVLPETFFKGIFKLPPAHYLIIKPGEAPAIERYWQLDYEIDTTLTEEQAVEQIHSAVQDSVTYHMVADVEVASFLSSGVDSNYLTASLHDQGGNIKTFTVGFETADGEKYNEISYAKQASDYLDVENYSHVITEDEFWDNLGTVQWHMDEPSADPAAVALYFVDREAAKKVKAVLSGEGSDEFFGGYTIYQTPLENQKLSWCPKPVLRLGSKILKTLGIRGANYLYRAGTPIEEQFIGNANMFSVEERARILKQSPSKLRPQDITAPYYRDVSSLDDVTKMQYIDMNLWLVGDILLKTDKMSMAHSLESRVPFLDKEVWSVARRLPTPRKVNLTTTKISLRKAAEKLLPKEFCEKRKLGFPVPTRVWLKQEKYYERVKNAFTNQVAETYFNTSELIALLDAHRRGEADNSRKIWTVYTFLIWHEVYFAA
ncbi:MAG: asparagine synthase (glutamine-hydrolyzing) [Raoultibacter sp.]